MSMRERFEMIFVTLGQISYNIGTKLVLISFIAEVAVSVKFDV